MKQIYSRFQEKGYSFALEEPMKKHTTFGIGGPADCLIEPADEEELRDILALCREYEEPCYILGNGSNLLVSDGGYRGTVIHIGKGFGQVTVEGNVIRAGAGAMLRKIAEAAKNAGLTGMEFASGIPGTLGGALVMNAGAYGGEMVQIVKEVTVVTRGGEIRTIPVEEMEMGYRTSCILARGYIAIGAVIELSPGDKEAIGARMAELNRMRKEKQPLEYPSAGSTFKRPEGYFAGKLIQDAGLRGFSVGGACVSEKHCGFVINKGNATCEDVIRLCEIVSDTVKEKFGVDLEMEIRRLGD